MNPTRMLSQDPSDHHQRLRFGSTLRVSNAPSTWTQPRGFAYAHFSLETPLRDQPGSLPMAWLIKLQLSQTLSYYRGENDRTLKEGLMHL